MAWQWKRLIELIHLWLRYSWSQVCWFSRLRHNRLSLADWHDTGIVLQVFLGLLRRFKLNACFRPDLSGLRRLNSNSDIALERTVALGLIQCRLSIDSVFEPTWLLLRRLHLSVIIIVQFDCFDGLKPSRNTVLQQLTIFCLRLSNLSCFDNWTDVVFKQSLFWVDN